MNEFIERLYQSPAGCIALGYILCMVADVLFSVANFYVERITLAIAFRRGRLRPLEWLDDSDIRYYVKKQIEEKEAKINDSGSENA